MMGISNCAPVSGEFFFLWHYHMYSTEFSELNTLDFKAKPFVQIRLNLVSDKSLEFLFYRLKIRETGFDNGVKRGSTAVSFDNVIMELQSGIDSTIYIPSIQDDSLLLEIVYLEENQNTQLKEVSLTTDMSEEFILDVEI